MGNVVTLDSKHCATYHTGHTGIKMQYLIHTYMLCSYFSKETMLDTRGIDFVLALKLLFSKFCTPQLWFREIDHIPLNN